jgi:hypothetical protein
MKRPTGLSRDATAALKQIAMNDGTVRGPLGALTYARDNAGRTVAATTLDQLVRLGHLVPHHSTNERSWSLTASGRELTKKVVTVKADNPARVEILYKTRGDNTRGKRFGYVQRVNTTGGMHFFDKSRSSEPGEPAFLVSRTSDGRSGAVWYSYEGLRFTKAPTTQVAGLSDDERVALDLLLSNEGNGKTTSTLAALVPDPTRRDLVRTLAAQTRTLRPR